MSKTRWGIVGTGTICNKFCNALKTIENAEITAVCSRTEEKGKAFAEKFSIPSVFTDVAQMAKCGDVDVIYIGVPHTAHAQAAYTALYNGKNVLCEKPFAVNRKQADKVIALAKEKGLFLMEGMWSRFLPAVCKAKEWADKGLIGEVKEIHACFCIPQENPDLNGRLFNPQLAGGALLDLGVYPIFISQLFFGGNPERFDTVMTPAETGIDRESSTVLYYSGNRKAYISTSFDHTAHSATIFGTDGFITIPEICWAHSAYLFSSGELKEQFCMEMENGMEYEAMHVMDCLGSGETASPLYPLSMTEAEMDICDAIRNKWGLHYPCENAMPHVEGEKKEKVFAPLSDKIDWWRDACFYHIYPLGFCGALYGNDHTGEVRHTLSKITEQADYIAQRGFNALYLGPVFESSYHGYDTADYGTVDRRLGDDNDLCQLVETMHSKGIRVILDGVFNHVGRDFWAFRDVLKNRESSPYCGWFNINFGGNSGYNDGLWYEGWEDHYDLVKLNLRNYDVKQYIFTTISGWIERYGIDGLRLDVAYCLDMDFLHELRSACKSKKADFFLLGECLHGDYNRWVNDSTLDSVTNYECYKGLYSSFNCSNMYEIGYSLNRQFGPDQWTIYKGKNLYSFIDNHDVPRIATILNDGRCLPVIYSLLFAMPGIPSVYYGSECAIEGDKRNGDEALRPEFASIDIYRDTELTALIEKLCSVRKENIALSRGGYRQLYVNSKQLSFLREYDGQRIVFALNFDTNEQWLNIGMNASGTELLTGEKVNISGGISLAPYSSLFILLD